MLGAPRLVLFSQDALDCSQVDAGARYFFARHLLEDSQLDLIETIFGLAQIVCRHDSFDIVDFDYSTHSHSRTDTHSKMISLRNKFQNPQKFLGRQLT